MEMEIEVRIRRERPRNKRKDRIERSDQQRWKLMMEMKIMYRDRGKNVWNG